MGCCSSDLFNSSVVNTAKTSETISDKTLKSNKVVSHKINVNQIVEEREIKKEIEKDIDIEKGINDITQKIEDLNLNDKIQIALKYPHTFEYQEIKNNGIIYEHDINGWIRNLYANSKWTHYIVYNDQTDLLQYKHHHTKGHTKGILCYNKTSISWLVHSVPNFPAFFNGKDISEILESEKKYGQSFCHVLFPIEKLNDVLINLNNMDPNIYISTDEIKKLSLKQHKDCFSQVFLEDNISHITKSPIVKYDIYEQICFLIKDSLFVETWIRGHEVTETNNVTHTKKIKIKNGFYERHSDHSKWAVAKNKPYIFIGDLNRMTSQFERGGGGILIKDEKLHKYFKSIILDASPQ